MNLLLHVGHPVEAILSIQIRQARRLAAYHWALGAIPWPSSTACRLDLSLLGWLTHSVIEGRLVVIEQPDRTPGVTTERTACSLRARRSARGPGTRQA